MRKIIKSVDPNGNFHFLTMGGSDVLCPLAGCQVHLCASWCSFSDVEVRPGSGGEPEMTVATCQGRPIGEIVEETITP